MRRSFFLLLLTALACSRPVPSRFVLRIAVPGPLAPFHPLASDTYTGVAADLVADAFLKPDEQGALTSRVLRRWERIDAQHFRIELDPNLRFSDGSPVRIEDAIASLLVGGFKVVRHGEWLDVESLETSEPVDAALLQQTLFKRTAAGFLGTGAFRLAEETKDRLVLERVRPLPRRVNRVEILAFPTTRDVLARVIRGEANAAMSLDERQLELLDGIPGLKSFRNLSPHSVVIAFNSARLDTVTRRRLRAALPLGEVAGAFAERCRPEAAPQAEHAALPPGPLLEILASHFVTSTDRVALAVRRALGGRGGEVVRLGATEVMARERAGQFDISVRTNPLWPPPILTLTWQSGSRWNYGHYSNPRADAAFERGDYAAARAELEADPPFIEVCRRERIGVVDARVKNPSFGPGVPLETLPDWEVDE